MLNLWCCVYTGHNLLGKGKQKAFSSKSFMKMRKRAGPKTDPGECWIILEPNLRLGHLRLLVECTQRVKSCAWTLFSHNKQVYVVAYCVEPFQMLCKNSQVNDSQPIQVADNFVHKLNHLGLTDPGNYNASHQIYHQGLNVFWCC